MFYCGAPILVLLTTGEAPLREAAECLDPYNPEVLLSAVERLIPPAPGVHAD